VTLPNLPTDNLYKFLALAGTVIVILSVYFVETKLAEVNDRILDTEEEQSLITERLELLQHKVKEFEQIVDSAIARQADNWRRDTNKVHLRYSESEIKALNREVRDSLAQIALENVKFRANLKRLSQLHERSKEVVYWGIFFVVNGFLLGLIGFYFWYRNVQKPLDSLLQKELLGKTKREKAA